MEAKETMESPCRQDSIDAVMQAEQEALEIQQAEAAAEQAAQEAAKAGRGFSANRWFPLKRNGEPF